MDLDIPQCTIPDIMAMHARHFPNKTALVFGDRRVSWGEMNRGINRVANKLLDSGLERGDKVATLMRTTLEHFYVFFGAMKAGGVIVPVSDLLSPDQIGGLVADAGARFLFTDPAHEAMLDACAEKLGGVRRDGFFSGDERGCWRSLQAWLSGAPEDEPPVRLMSDDDANISYSSGTTGVPKGVVYSHRARLHFGFAYAMHMHIDTATVGIGTTPLWSNGTSIIMYPTLFSGGTLVFMDGFDAGRLQEMIERERITHTFMVPTQFVKMLAHPDFGMHDLSSMKRYITAGSPMRLDLKQDVMEMLGPRLSELYGLSEGGVTMIRPDELVQRPTSCGTPLPGFECRIIGADDKELPRGETGEIIFHGGWAMRRYHGRPEQTRDAIWRDERGRSFVRTGDIGRMDEDGYLYVVDRKKDMIISGGFNIFPADIEAVVSQHPGVLDVCVVGAAHPLWGESPVAAVIARPGAVPDAQELKEWANCRLAKTQRVAAVILRDDFPRNAMGKVVKPDLRREYADLLMKQQA
jgi:acyl-CoA synthetase (AMP-forming)/AMP-acid ligase II